MLKKVNLMGILRCDKPYNLDEVRKRKGLPRTTRADSRTTLYELTIRIPRDYHVYIDGKTKFTKRVFVLNRRELQDETRLFEDEKNAELDAAIAAYGLSLEATERKAASLPLNEDGYCTTPLTEYAERYIEVRSHGSVSESTIKNELSYMRYVRPTIGDKAMFEITPDDIEGCLIEIPHLSRIWAQERVKEWEQNRQIAKWAQDKKTLAKPFKEPRIAGSDMQAKVLKFLREVFNYALDKEHVRRNPAHARFLSRVFKQSKPLIDPLMADEAARFLEAVEKLPLGWFKLSLLSLFCTGIRPEEMQALMSGSFLFGEVEAATRITGAVKHGGIEITEYPKTNAGRRTIPIASLLADTAKEWIAVKSQMMEDMGLLPTMRMPLMSNGPKPHAYNTWRRQWVKFIDDNGFSGIRPYALRHTYATQNLANGENIKTLSVLMGHESPSYTLDLYAGYVPNTAMGIGSRYIDYIRSTAKDCGFV